MRDGSAGPDRGAVATGFLGCGYSRLGFWSSTDTEAKEPRAIPVGAGNGLGNAGETRISLLTPEKPVRHYGDGVPLALIFADEDRASLQPAANLVRLFAL